MKASLFLSVVAMICLSQIVSTANASEVSVLGGIDISTVSESLTGGTGTVPDYGSVTRPTFGADYHYELDPLLGVEAGLFYQKRGSSASSDALAASGLTSQSVTANYLTIPVMLRLTAIPKYLRAGVGLYYSFSMGDLNLSQTAVDGTKTETTSTFSSASLNSSDFGLIGSVRGMYPVTPMIDVIGDVRYQLGLRNISQAPNTSTKMRDLIFMVGASLKI